MRKSQNSDTPKSEENVNSTEENPNSTTSEIEEAKREIQITSDLINSADPVMKPILTQLLKEQTQHLTDLESKSTNHETQY